MLTAEEADATPPPATAPPAEKEVEAPAAASMPVPEATPLPAAPPLPAGPEAENPAAIAAPAAPVIPVAPNAEIVAAIGDAVQEDSKSMRTLTLKSKKRSLALLGEKAAWDGLTEAELKEKLMEALQALRDKERDLTMAAEIGQQLVTANAQLMDQYQDLVDKIKVAERQHRQAVITHTTSSNNAIDFIQTKVPGQQQIGYQEPRLIEMQSPTTPTSFSAPALGPPPLKGAPDGIISPQDYEALKARVEGLEKSNSELRNQLDQSINSLRETERKGNREVSSLRRTNQSLQDQLRDTLQDLRDAEHSHTRSVASLERDLERLRHELDVTAQAAADLESERRKLMREKAEARRDTKDLEISDSATITTLQNRIRALESERSRLEAQKRDAERRITNQRMELETLSTRVVELETREHETKELRNELERQCRLVEELREQLEDHRNKDIAAKEEFDFYGHLGEHLDGFLDDKALIALENGEEWQWVKWLERARTKCWERDVSGLKEEIDNLRIHREEAYLRLRDTIEEIAGQVSASIPGPIASVGKGVLDAVPTPIVSLTNSIAGGVQSAGLRVLGIPEKTQTNEQLRLKNF
ncbi:hypothetical protein HK104_005112 [Borealophlyctis nickersoniae]|nr:hypothetical protein HK104_005112 [Borealophlyctis nickersoniae]